MRELLDARPSGYRPPESNLESRFQKVLRRDLQPTMARQLDVGNDEAWLGRVDFIDRDRRVIVEVQSDLHHTSVSDVRDDQKRRAALTTAGWSVCEVGEWELWHQPTEVQARVRAARGL
jgi:very-short-patch-repair endonuclease